jgi:hypothetical protein
VTNVRIKLFLIIAANCSVNSTLIIGL